MGWGSLNSQQRIAVMLQLLGGPQYRAELAGAAAGTARLGGATRATGLAMRTASQRTFLMNQALFTMRRYAFYGVAAILTLSAGLIKLGYSYLSTRDSATAALKPIFRDSKALNRELDYLFQLSKYSPFVLADMTTALRVMYPALHSSGMGVKDMNDLLLAMTNILSASGKTTPAALSRISYAIQHMINQGRLTGVLVRSLSSAGVPVNLLLKQLGVAGTNLSNIARLNISPNSVIAAIIKLSQTNRYFKDAAARLAMKSFPGMLQVMRDSLSQFMGVFLGSTYDKFRNKLSGLISKGGLLDQLGKAKPHQAIMILSTALTGNTGLGRGLELLASLTKNVALVFTNILVPAFVMGAHSLILFYPILFTVNTLLGYLAHHAWLVKYVLVPLTAWFILTRSAMLGMYLGGKLLNIMLIGNIKFLWRWFFILRAVEGRTATMLVLTRLWSAALKGQIIWTTATGARTVALASNMTKLERIIIATRMNIIKLVGWIIATSGAFWTWLTTTYAASGAMGVLRGALTAVKIAAIEAWAATLGPIAIITAAVIVLAAWLYLVVTRFDQIKKGFGSLPRTIAHPVREIQNNPNKNEPFWRGLLRGQLGGSFAEGGITSGGWSLVGEKGPEVLNLPRGSQITPLTNKAVTPIGSLSAIGAGDGRPIVVQLHVNRRVLAEEVVRAKQDTEARR